MTLAFEIQEQPEVLARLLADTSSIGRVGRAIREFRPDNVVIAARGTSDHAAVYAQYLLGVRHRLPVGLASPSILSLYGVTPRFGRTLVIGLSQSGASPDVVGVLEAGRRQGVVTVAITNDPASPLADAAEFVIDLKAGPERAVAATKTYTAELLALAMLSAAMERPDDLLAADPDLAAVPGVASRCLETDSQAADVARDLASREACIVVGRGFSYATAREWALKLKELARVIADPYSAADFRHGPLALVEAGFPVLAVASAGDTATDLAELLRHLRDELEADLLVLSDQAELRALGHRSICLPGGLPEHLAPIASIVPAQLFAMHLTVARGLDPDRPRNIAKVTRTR
jgi:glucosamine--fructose-6-phosphate aminotransferase (isomerizing)